MYLEDLEDRLKAIEAVFGDWEVAHAMEDQLMVEMIELAVDGDLLPEVAERYLNWSLETQRVRWYA